jgi:hypothetical protein
MEYLVKNYEKNMEALKTIAHDFYERLINIKPNESLELIQGQTPFDFNIYDKNNDKYIYPKDNIKSTIEKKINDLDEYSEYSFLYMFGMGNGAVIRSSLHNKNLIQLVVFEPNIEMLFIAFHLWDFSQELTNNRLKILDANKFDFIHGLELALTYKAKFFAKCFVLQTPSDYYYEVYGDMMQNVNKMMLDGFEHIIMNAGNNVEDSLIGLDHHTANLKKMIEGPIFKDNFTRKHKTDTVVLASSGPSLGKQLPYLKEIQDYVTIICGESTLKILELNGVKPDFCVSLERIVEVVKSFENVADEYKKDVVFVRASLQHKDVFDVLKGVQDVLVMRPFKWIYQFGLHKYGYLAAGTSVANMAHELAIAMGFKTCIIIGQDLAYAEDGSSHSKGHNFGTKQDKLGITDEITAYGGRGLVKTNYIWKLFLRGLAETIFKSKDILLTINSTEGGARIDGTLELPFKEAVKKYVDFSKKKEKYSMVYPEAKEVEENFELARSSIDFLLKGGIEIRSVVDETFLMLQPIVETFRDKPLEEQFEILSDAEIKSLLDKIEKVRQYLNKSECFTLFYYDIAQPNIVHTELELSRIKVRKVHNHKEQKTKMLEWIIAHGYYLFSISGYVQNIMDRMEKANPFKED